MLAKLTVGITIVLMVHLSSAGEPLQAELRHTPTYNCSLENLPTLWAFNNPPLEIRSHAVTFSEQGKTSVFLQFSNLAGNSVSAVALVVEYVDEDGRSIDIVPMVGATNGLIATFVTPFAAQRFLANAWNEAIPQGASLQVDGIKDGVRTGRCPASARITFLKIRFQNGRTRSFSSPGWQIPPIPATIPRVEGSFPKLLTTPASDILATARINILGRATVVSAGGAEQSPDLVEWFRKWMEQHWEFHPALRAGRPVETEITILFRIMMQSPRNSSARETTPDPVTLIELFQKDNDPGSWLVSYGTLLQGATVKSSY